MGGKQRRDEKKQRSRYQRGPIENLSSKEYHSLNLFGNLRSCFSKRIQVRTPCAATCTKKGSKSKRSGCLGQSSREQRRPKFGSQKSIGRELPIPQFGPFTAESAIGTSNQKKTKSVNGQTETRTFGFNFALFCLYLIFAASIINITVATHNFHGLKSCSDYQRSCLQRLGGIWMGQEHWLMEQQLPLMSSIGTQFVARSGMEDAISAGICQGRPFGGVSIAWSPNLNNIVKPLANFRHKRVVCVETNGENENLLFICVYMPFFDSSKRDECMTETTDAISMVETIIDSHPLHSIIIGGDLNTELKGDSPFDPLWHDLTVKYNLSCCDQFISGNDNYTYKHESLGHRKWNDHFFVSNSLITKTKDIPS